MILARYLHNDLRSDMLYIILWGQKSAINAAAGDRVEGVGLQRWGGLITLSVVAFAIR